MKYSVEVENMCPLAKGAYHGPAPIHDKVYNDLIAFNVSVCIGVRKRSNQRKLFMSLIFKQLFTHNEVTFC